MKVKTFIIVAAALAVVGVQTYYFLPPDQSLPWNIPLSEPLPKSTVAFGLGDKEDWGRWTIGPKAEINFFEPVAEPVNLSFAAKGFGPNVGKTAEVVCEGVRHSFALQSEMENYTFPCSKGIRKITFHVPQPVSPQTLGISADPRPLGLGIVNFKIESMPL